MRPRAGLGYTVFDQVNRKRLSTCNNKCQTDRGQLFNRNYIFTLSSVFISIDSPHVCNFGFKASVAINFYSHAEINHTQNQILFSFFSFEVRSCFSHSFTDFFLQGPNLHLLVKKLPRNPTLFQQGGRDSPFYKLTPEETAVLQYPRLPHVLLCWQIHAKQETDPAKTAVDL